LGEQPQVSGGDERQFGTREGSIEEEALLGVLEDIGGGQHNGRLGYTQESENPEALVWARGAVGKGDKCMYVPQAANCHS